MSNVKFLIFNTENGAQGRCNQFNNQYCPSPSGITTEYSRPRKHPTENKWAVAILKEELGDIKAPEQSALTDLDETWFVNEEV